MGAINLISNLEEAINRDMFRSYSQKCLEKLIFTVSSELKVEDESNRIDFITTSIKSNKELTLFCRKCNSEYKKSVMCCTVYENNPSNFVSCGNLYGDISCGHQENW